MSINNTREFSITPFYLQVFPSQLNRFCTVILSPPGNPLLSGTLQLILNSFSNPSIVKADSAYTASAQFTCRTGDLNSKVALVDLCGAFTNIHPNIVQFDPTLSSWIRNHYYRNLIIPNNLLQTGVPGDWDKNYSHTIFFAREYNDIPQVILTNTHLVFCISPDLIRSYLRRKIGIEISNIDLDVVIAVTSTLRSNTQIMSIPSKRLQSKPPEQATISSGSGPSPQINSTEPP